MEALENVQLAETCSLEELCTEIGKLFSVNCTEIGLLRAEGHFLKFISPLNCRSPVPFLFQVTPSQHEPQPRRKSELFNNFPNVPHHTVLS